MWAPRHPSISTAWCATTSCGPASNQADIQVNFVSKDERKPRATTSPRGYRPPIQAIGDRWNARVKIVEIPPGPPVLSTLVAEIYGPDFERQIGNSQGD